MGGMDGMGPVVVEKNEPVFHAAWEGRMHALQLAAGVHGKWNIDMARYSRERMPAADYLAASYYERWIFGLEKLLVEQGLVTADELASGRAPGKAEVARVLGPADVAAFIANRRGTRVDVPIPPRFVPGDAVVARNINPAGHTRLPRYVRGRQGGIHSDHGVFTFPDTNARSRDPKPQHCYSVRFSARELWGPDASLRDSVYVDLWDEYLDAA